MRRPAIRDNSDFQFISSMSPRAEEVVLVAVDCVLHNTIAVQLCLPKELKFGSRGPTTEIDVSEKKSTLYRHYAAANDLAKGLFLLTAIYPARTVAAMMPEPQAGIVNYQQIIEYCDKYIKENARILDLKEKLPPLRLVVGLVHVLDSEQDA